MAVSTTTNSNDAAVPFKLWHMTHRTTHPDFPPRHPFKKHRASEEAAFTEMAKMSPVHMGRKSSTYDEDLLEKSSEAGLIAGDANMAAYHTGGSRQGSTSVHDSCFQEMVRYYLRAYTGAHQGDPYCCPNARFVSANPAQVDGRQVRRPLEGCGRYGLGKFQALTVW